MLPERTKLTVVAAELADKDEAAEIADALVKATAQVRVAVRASHVLEASVVEAVRGKTPTAYGAVLPSTASSSTAPSPSPARSRHAGRYARSSPRAATTSILSASAPTCKAATPSAKSTPTPEALGAARHHLLRREEAVTRTRRATTRGPKMGGEESRSRDGALERADLQLHVALLREAKGADHQGMDLGRELGVRPAEGQTRR